MNEDEVIKPNIAAARSTARTLIKQLSLTKVPVILNDVVIHLRKTHENLAVYPWDLGKHDGITFGDAIGYNPDKPASRKRFTVAHEIGHYLLGHNGVNASYQTGKNWNRIEETEASQFAGELLVPSELLKIDVIKNKITSVKSLANRYWVSEQMMWRRVNDCRLFSKIG